MGDLRSGGVVLRSGQLRSGRITKWEKITKWAIFTNIIYYIFFNVSKFQEPRVATRQNMRLKFIDVLLIYVIDILLINCVDFNIIIIGSPSATEFEV